MSFDPLVKPSDLKIADDRLECVIAHSAELSSKTGAGTGPCAWHVLGCPPETEIWVFGYGSLMWNPEFPYIESRPALLDGYHRRFCVYSYQFRGTPERPGLVLGLDEGGSCHGMAFRVAAKDQANALSYLWDREMSTSVYCAKMLPIRLGDETVQACTFVVDRNHEHYCSNLCVEEAAQCILRSVGKRGPNIDYLVNTVRHLEAMGIAEQTLLDLMATVQRFRSAPDCE